LTNVCVCAKGFAGVKCVVTGELEDRQNSFFLAETLKYLFLAHSPDNPVQVIKNGGKDWPEWVFNTECHPMRVVRGASRK